MLGGLLGGLLGPVGGLTGSVTGAVSNLYDAALGIGETLSPGVTEGNTLTGNLLNPSGVAGDLLTNVAELDVSGAVLDTYANVVGPGGVINDLGEGGGLGIEGLLGGALGTADGFLGVGDGLLDGLLGVGDGLLG